MKSISKRLIHYIGLIVLVSLACNTPIKSFLQSDQPPADDPGSSQTGPGPSASEHLVPHNTDGAEVTYIPGGTFQMGSAAPDELADEDEFPQHQVTVSDLYIYTYEVTNQMYNVCVEAGYCIIPNILESGSASHYGDLEYADHPVVGVDWLMARDYCAWAEARLPTEAEWELVSRSPDNLIYPWGEEEPTCSLVNMGGCQVPPDTQFTGYYLLGNSPDEVWDMSGNVWEWTHDWYADNYYSQSPEHNPIGPLEPQDPDNPLRVIRGGGLNSEPDKMRSASRKGLNPYRPFTDVGFRCVTGDGISLPAAYDLGDEFHERVPPDGADGGDSADDDPHDERFIRSGEIFGPCPDGSGTLRLVVPASSSDPIREMMARYEGDHWDPSCEHDPATGTAICEGPEPAGYLTIPPPSFPLDICIDIGYSGICFERIPVWKPTDCGGDDEASFSVEAFAGCIDTETTAAIVHFMPEDAPFGSGSTDTMHLDCTPRPEEGFYRCDDIPGSPEDLVDLHFSTSDGRSDSASVTIPNCSVSMRIEPHCIDVGGVTTPSLILQFYGVEAIFVGAEANGTDLVCSELGDMIYSCVGLTGIAGDPLSVTATFDTGAVLEGTSHFPECGGPVDFLEPWVLVEVGCHSESEYYGVIDTNLDVEFTGWRLEDVPAPKICGEQPGRPGYWYCNFPINDWYTTITFCAEWIGGPGENCETFPEAAFGSRLPATCSTGNDDEPSDEDPCSVHNQTACQTTYSNVCNWVGGECVSP